MKTEVLRLLWIASRKLLRFNCTRPTIKLHNLLSKWHYASAMALLASQGICQTPTVGAGTIGSHIGGTTGNQTLQLMHIARTTNGFTVSWLAGHLQTSTNLIDWFSVNATNSLFITNILERQYFRVVP